MTVCPNDCMPMKKKEARIRLQTVSGLLLIGFSNKWEAVGTDCADLLLPEQSKHLDQRNEQENHNQNRSGKLEVCGKGDRLQGPGLDYCQCYPEQPHKS